MIRRHSGRDGATILLKSSLILARVIPRGWNGRWKMIGLSSRLGSVVGSFLGVLGGVEVALVVASRNMGVRCS